MSESRIQTGTIDDETIAGVLVRIGDRVNEFAVVVRCIDSSHEVSDIARILKLHDVQHQIRNGNVTVEMPALRDKIAELFFGFDELWLFDALPPTDLSIVPCITSDGIRFSAGIPESLRNLVDATGCVLALGDGCGLNYATRDEVLARQIKNT